MHKCVIFSQLLPSAMKLRRLCFYRRLSVHRGVGGGVCLSAWWDTPPGQTSPGADAPREQTPPPEQTYPLEQTPPPGSRHHPPGVDTPQSTHPPSPPRDGHCCGRYGSYWNAFLFITVYVNINITFIF